MPHSLLGDVNDAGIPRGYMPHASGLNCVYACTIRITAMTLCRAYARRPAESRGTVARAAFESLSPASPALLLDATDSSRSDTRLPDAFLETAAPIAVRRRSSVARSARRKLLDATVGPADLRRHRHRRYGRGAEAAYEHSHRSRSHCAPALVGRDIVADCRHRRRRSRSVRHSRSDRLPRAPRDDSVGRRSCTTSARPSRRRSQRCSTWQATRAQPAISRAR